MADSYYSSDLDVASPPLPSAPLRKKRRRRTLGLAGLAETPIPRGQMVSGIYVAPNPLESAVAGLSRGLGMRETRAQAEDVRAQAEAAQAFRERALEQQGALARERMTSAEEIARQRTVSAEDIARQRADIARDLQEWRESTATTREELRKHDQELREREQALRERGLSTRERQGGRSLKLREQAEARQRAKLSGGERRRLGQPKPTPPPIDDLME